jgi:hypothetical protein
MILFKVFFRHKLPYHSCESTQGLFDQAILQISIPRVVILIIWLCRTRINIGELAAHRLWCGVLLTLRLCISLILVRWRVNRGNNMLRWLIICSWSRTWLTHLREESSPIYFSIFFHGNKSWENEFLDELLSLIFEVL